MNNEYLFFVATLLLCLVIYKFVKMAHNRENMGDQDDQRSGNDRRKTVMYRIPERRNLSVAGDEQDRRGVTAEAISGTGQRRSGNDRRKGGSRRQWRMFKIPENRKTGNRRGGLDRRKSPDPINPVVA